ncbi:MAG TPA: glycosyltransferase family 2 protein, partial [Clostridia bacterium]|nr:glycosyltransferase family 2 protein [Clostridia bacterium]
MQVSAIIPAFNEERTIAQVIRPLLQVGEIMEVIVVSDGCTDATPEIARQEGVQVIASPDNLGKGGAMMLGLERSSGEVILFLDADLIGLTPVHIEELLRPVLDNRAEMSVGIFGHGRLTTDLAQMVAPFLSGQRAVKRSLLERISNLDMTRFGIEMALTRYVNEHDINIAEVLLPDLSHVMKEEKFGLWKGLRERMKMYWEIA